MKQLSLLLLLLFCADTHPAHSSTPSAPVDTVSRVDSLPKVQFELRLESLYGGGMFAHVGPDNPGSSEIGVGSVVAEFSLLRFNSESRGTSLTGFATWYNHYFGGVGDANDAMGIGVLLSGRFGPIEVDIDLGPAIARSYGMYNGTEQHYLSQFWRLRQQYYIVIPGDSRRAAISVGGDLMLGLEGSRRVTMIIGIGLNIGYLRERL